MELCTNEITQDTSDKAVDSVLGQYTGDITRVSSLTASATSSESDKKCLQYGLKLISMQDIISAQPQEPSIAEQ